MSQVIQCDNCMKLMRQLEKVEGGELQNWIHNGEYKLDFCSQKCQKEWWFNNNPKEF